MQTVFTFIAFVAVVIVVYSLLNYYFIRKHNNVVTTKSLAGVLLRLLLITVILTPVATVIFSLHDIPVLAAVTGFTGYSWLAFLFLFLSIHGTADIVLLIAEKGGYRPPPHLGRALFLATVICSALVLVYGYHEAREIRVERIAISTDKLPSRVSKVTIAQLSDIHFSPLVSSEMARRIADILWRENPDLIVSTGDYLDRGIRNDGEIKTIMADLAAPLGKYAVPGNHEFIAGIDLSAKVIGDSGFRLLRNERVLAGGIIALAGVDDLSAKRFGVARGTSEKALLAHPLTGVYTILLKHQPRIADETRGLYDLQLSGHTHGGQIFPFTLLVKLAFPKLCGLYDLGGGASLYVSRGTGTWGPPFRFLAPPEITVIELRNAARVR